MPKGLNTFVFNTSTMKEIVQYYLDNKLLKDNVSGLTVTEFKQTANTAIAPTFDVVINADFEAPDA